MLFNVKQKNVCARARSVTITQLLAFYLTEISE